MSGAVLRRGHAEHATEARRERADAPEPHGEADVRDRAVGVPQQRSGAFEPAHEQVLVRRLAELTLELAAEVRGRELRHARERLDVERLPIPSVDEILRAQEMASGVWRDHAPEYRRGREARKPQPAVM